MAKVLNAGRPATRGYRVSADRDTWPMARSDRVGGHADGRSVPHNSWEDDQRQTHPKEWGTPPPYPGVGGAPRGSNWGPGATSTPFRTPEGQIVPDGLQDRRTPYQPERPRPYGFGSGNSHDSGSHGRSRGPRPKFNLRTFGKDNSYTIEEFLSTTEDYVASFEDCPAEAVSSVKSYLAGEAAAIVHDAGVTTWEEIRKVLLEHYVPLGHERANQSALSYLKRERGENPCPSE